MSQGIDANNLRQRLLIACQQIEANEDALSAADREIGDGDHGIGMAKAFRSAADDMRATDPAINNDFDLLGHRLLMAGGTSGVIFGTLFITLGQQLPDVCVDTNTLAGALRKAANKIQQRGRVAPGDKTMIDALVPAIEAFEKERDRKFTEALTEAAHAARRGAESTRDMQAQTGRARSLGGRSIGHPDPGALTIALFFEALAY